MTARHSKCPERETPDPNAIHLSRSTQPFVVGGVVRLKRRGDKPDQIVYVESASQEYCDEDDMSFGGDGESGYIYSATGRLATGDEAAHLLAREVQRREQRERQERHERAIADINRMLSTNHLVSGPLPKGSVEYTGRR